MTDKVVIVLGAKGFIGRYVSKELSRLGVKVIGVGHGKWEEQDFREWGLSHWKESEINIESIKECLNSNEMLHSIIHCGGTGTVASAHSNPRPDFQRTVVSTSDALEFVRAFQPSCRFDYISSAAVYGGEYQKEILEGSPLNPISPYGYNKRISEDMCSLYHGFYKVNVSIVRLFSVYGEGLKKQLLWDASNKLAKENYNFFGTGNELRDWIHAEDAAKLIALASLSKNQASLEIYNGGNVKATTKEILSKLVDTLKKQQKLYFNGEANPGNPTALIGSCDYAKSKLGWQPTINLQEGIGRYVNWFKEQEHYEKP